MVVVDVRGTDYSQRFYRARPSAVPVFAVASASKTSPSLSTTPKANDARNRVGRSSRETLYGSSDWGDSQPKTWTSRERIKSATCVSLSKDGRFLAVGETGYAPRILIFSIKDTSSDTPLVSISEHDFGVRAVAWSQDGKYLASLGTANDGFLFIWRVDPRTGSTRLYQQNRCTAQVNGMIWLGNTLITYGTRHVRAWKVGDEVQRPSSPSKKASGGDANLQNAQKTLPGRNVLLGSLLEASFTCSLSLDESRALFGSDGGDICLLDDTSGQMKLTRVGGLGVPVTCCTQRGPLVLIAGNNGSVATVSIEEIISGRAQDDVELKTASGPDAFAAMGFVQDQLVTVNSQRSIHVRKAEYLLGVTDEAATEIKLSGHSDPVLGIQAFGKTAAAGSTFFTWSGSGKVFLWDLDGCLRKTLDIGVDEVYSANETDSLNQLCVVRADKNGVIFAAGDRVGVLRVLDHATGELLLEAKAHSSEITHIAVHHDDTKTLVATCGRDRTVQLFHRTSGGSFDLLQTLEYPSRVTHLIFSSDEKIITCSMDRNVRVHELISKVGDPDTLAAFQCRSIALKASPTSMALDPDSRLLWVSTLDRSIYHFDLEVGRQLGAFKCVDESGSETAILDSLVFGPSEANETSFLLGLSNTDKSIRMYDPTTGVFMDREWGHTESINGVALVDDDGVSRKVVSVGCDGTIMIWDVDLRDPSLSATSRSPSPAKDSSIGSNKPPLRRVLSKAELAEFQRPSSSHGSGRSPSGTLRKQKSRNNLSSSSAAPVKTPNALTYHFNNSSNSSLVGESPSRRTSSSQSCNSPTDASPNLGRLTRRPSLPALGSTPNHSPRKKSSAINLRSSYGFGSLQMASEQTCRQLRTYRQKLSSADPINPETIVELEAELRLTIAAIGERANRGKQVVAESILSDLLDQYSDKLVTLLDEKLKLRIEGRDGNNSILGLEENLVLLRPPAAPEVQERPRTAYATTRPADT